MRVSTLGKILGALGMVALCSAPYTYFISAGSGWAAGVKALLGVMLIGGFFATNVGDLGQFASRKATFFFLNTAAMALGVLVALSALNYLVAKRGKSWDLTAKRIFTLAPQTSGVLGALPGPVRVLAFVSARDPGYDSCQRMLQRFHHRAKDRFDYTFRDPHQAPDLAQKFHLREGQTTLVLSRGEGTKETRVLINYPSGQDLSEQELTQALMKLVQVGTEKVYVLAGHGEWPLEKDPGDGPNASSIAELASSMQQEGYVIEPLNLAGRTEVPRDAALVLLAGSRGRISAPEERSLADYMDQGGRLVVFAEAEQDMGLKTLLARYGVELDPGIIADDHYSVQSPYVIVSAFYSDHPMARELKRLQLNVQLPTARGLSVLKEGLAAGVVAEPVLLTSPFAWEELTLAADPVRSNGEKSGSIPLVVASTRKINATPERRFEEARLVVVGDSELLVDANWGHEANRNLVLNAFAWATHQAAGITLRPPDRDISTLDVNDKVMRRIRFASTDLLPLALLGIGLAVWLRRRDQ